MTQKPNVSPSDPFPMVHPLTFRQNPLIQHLANDPFWTVSDDDKRPVNARILLEKGLVFNAKFENNKESPLVTLHELDDDPKLQAVNRAYRLQARVNRVIAIDVEPHAPEEMKQQVLAFPAHYTELSKNGGVHLVIRVPDDLITEQNKYMFEELSVFKEPVPKDEKGKEIRSAYFEVLFNHHYMTFTKRMDTQKPCVDYNQDRIAKQKLEAFLQTIVQMDEQKKKERELAKQYSVHIMNQLLDEEKQKQLQKFLSLKAFNEAIEQASHKKVEDFGKDYSRYEMGVATGLAFHTTKIHKLAKGTRSFSSLAKSITEQDLVYAIYMLLKDIVPYREKHDGNREGLPWLLFTSKRAYEYVKAQNEKRERDRRNRT